MEKRCAHCGNAIEEYATRLHEELSVCGDDCGIDIVAEKDANYARACRRVQAMRESLQEIKAIDPKEPRFAQYGSGYAAAFGAAEMEAKLGLWEENGVR